MSRKYPYGFYHRSFILGEYYYCPKIYGFNIFQFIKVTRKGFNLLDIITYRCLFERHLYSRKWANKEIPSNIKKINSVVVKDDYMFKTIKNKKRISDYLIKYGVENNE